MKNFNELIAERFSNKENELDFFSESIYSRLADQILLLRKKRGITQKQLAEMVGTTQAVISRLEAASVKPSLETVVKVVRKLEGILEIRLHPYEELRVANKLPQHIQTDKMPKAYYQFKNSISKTNMMTKETYMHVTSISSENNAKQLTRWC